MTIRWGVIGVGDIVRKRVTRAILDDPNSEFEIACRRDHAKLARFCADFGIQRSTMHAEEVIQDPNVDAVYVASPVNLHLEQTLAAAAAGKHVLCEKPMALSTDECDQMIAGCLEHGVQLGVAYYRRFYPIVLRIKQLIAAGEIGRPLAISAVTSTPFAFSPGEDGYWRVVLAQGGGGPLMDVGSHRINLFLDLMGSPTSVKAHCDTVAADYEAEDCASLSLRFASGSHGSLQCFFGTSVDPDEFTVLGTRGRLVAAPLNGDTLRIDSGSGQREESHAAPANLHGPLVEDFSAALLANREPTVTGIEGRATNAVIAAAYQDARTNRPGIDS